MESRQDTYQNRLRAKRKEISELVGDKVVVKSSGNEIVWEVITNHTAPEEKKEVSDARKKQWVELGYNEIKTLMEAEKFVDPTTVSDDGTSNLAIPLRPKSIDYCTVFVKLWLKLSFNDWSKTFEKFNDCISAHNEQQSKNIKEFTRSEFLTCFSLFIGAVVFSVSGARLWDVKSGSKCPDSEWLSLIPHPGYEKYMKLYRFKQFRMIIPKIYEQVDLKDTDPWYRFKGAIDEFNTIRKVS